LADDALSRESVAKQIAVARAELDRLQAMLASFDPATPANDISAGWIRSILRARRRREEIFGAEIFADPAWDILLELYAIELERGRITISRLCDVATVPFSTGVRHISQLEQSGLLVRQRDPNDRRRTFVKLSRLGAVGMAEYFGKGKVVAV
jgi:LPS sulfotransferase NodH